MQKIKSLQVAIIVHNDSLSRWKAERFIVKYAVYTVFILDPAHPNGLKGTQSQNMLERLYLTLGLGKSGNLPRGVHFS